MSKSKKNEKTVPEKEVVTQTVKAEKTVSKQETVKKVVETFKAFVEASKLLESKSDNETFDVSIKGLQKKVSRLHNKASRNDILKALRDGKTVVVMTDEKKDEPPYHSED